MISQSTHFCPYSICYALISAVNVRRLKTLSVGQESQDAFDDNLDETMCRIMATCIVSTVTDVVCLVLSVLTMSMLWIPIDSAVNSMCTFLSFRMECTHLIRKYMCWPFGSNRQSQPVRNIKKRSHTQHAHVASRSICVDQLEVTIQRASNSKRESTVIILRGDKPSATSTLQFKD